jgi:hypothetical protein
MIKTKDTKKNIYLLSLEALELLDLLLCLIFFYTLKIPTWTYIVFVAAVPFILTCMEFYPSMDIVQKIKMAFGYEISLLVFFGVDLAFYIVCMFILR